MSGQLLAEVFWTDRWERSSAVTLPLEARGLYREMLSRAWSRGARLPNNHEAIRRLSGCTLDEWERSWPLISSYWRVDGSYLVNDTQLAIYERAVESHQSHVLRGRKGRRAQLRAGHKKKRGSNSGSASGSALPVLGDPDLPDHPDITHRSTNQLFSKEDPPALLAPGDTFQNKTQEQEGSHAPTSGDLPNALRDREEIAPRQPDAGSRRVEGAAEGHLHRAGVHLPESADADRQRARGSRSADAPSAAPAASGAAGNGSTPADARGGDEGAPAGADHLQATINRLRDSLALDEARRRERERR